MKKTLLTIVIAVLTTVVLIFFGSKFLGYNLFDKSLDVINTDNSLTPEEATSILIESKSNPGLGLIITKVNDLSFYADFAFHNKFPQYKILYEYNDKVVEDPITISVIFNKSESGLITKIHYSYKKYENGWVIESGYEH